MLFHNNDRYTAPILFHSHDYYEIYFFVDGNVRYYVEDEDYELKKGDVLIIPPGKMHRPVIENDVPYERYVLWILNSYLRHNEGLRGLVSDIDGIIREKNTRLVHLAADEQDVVWALLDRVLENQKCDVPYMEYVSESCVVLALDDLRQRLLDTPRNEGGKQDLVRRIIVYLNENYVRAPSLDELSEKFFVSKYYLSHRFKEYTKTSVHNYILMKKINMAKGLLEKGMSPQDVSEECGFSTYSNFYKVFVDKTGISPKNYK